LVAEGEPDMARKTLHTRQKLVFRLDGLRPRNPLATVVRMRKAGAHGKTVGAQRVHARTELKRLVSRQEED
jgi:hypothetical protein